MNGDEKDEDRREGEPEPIEESDVGVGDSLADGEVEETERERLKRD